MTRKALLGRQEKRLKLSEKYAELRKELKARGDYRDVYKRQPPRHVRTNEVII